MDEQPVRTFFISPRPQIAADLMSNGEVVIQIWQLGDNGDPDHHHITLDADCAAELARGILDLLKSPGDLKNDL